MASLLEGGFTRPGKKRILAKVLVRPLSGHFPCPQCAAGHWSNCTLGSLPMWSQTAQQGSPRGSLDTAPSCPRR